MNLPSVTSQNRSVNAIAGWIAYIVEVERHMVTDTLRRHNLEAEEEIVPLELKRSCPLDLPVFQAQR